MKENRKCRKCGEHIPFSIRINGETKFLKSRKYCLTCSPYKKWLLKEKKEKVSRYQGSEKHKELIKVSLYKRGLERKTTLIEQKGGCCERCGYKKSRRVLTFHHENPSEKKFGFSINELWSRTWTSILEEVEKCTLLCMNCHAEVEEEIKEKNETSLVKKVNAKYGTNY